MPWFQEPARWEWIADLSGLWGSSMQVMHGRPKDFFQDDKD